MAGITTCVTDSFRNEILTKTHDFTITTGNVFKVALIKVGCAGTYGKATTNYSDITGNTDEVTGTGYSAGGFAWTAAQNVTPVTVNHVTVATWSVNPSWTSATFSTIGDQIYNSSASNKAVELNDYGGTQTVTAGTLTLILPTANDTSSIIRIA